MTNLRLLEEVETTDEAQHDLRETRPSPQVRAENTFALSLLLTALKALSQRTIVALAALQTTLAIGSALFLSYTVIASAPAPSMLQVTGTAIYDLFVIAALWLTRR